MPTIPCPKCRQDLAVPDDMLGRPVRCSACMTTFTAGRLAAPRVPPARRGYDDDFDDRPARRSVRGPAKPDKVQAIGVMVLVGGILATLSGLGVLIWLGVAGIASMGFGFICCLWPGPYYGLVLGILAITRGAALIGEEAYRQPPPRGIAVMQIINIINGDVANCILGILTLAFLSDRDTSDYYRG
jgi:hypothetical protein